MPRHAYHASLIVAHDRSAREGGQVREIDVAGTGTAAAMISADGEAVDLVWIEPPTNPMLGAADILAICEVAHVTGALVVVDNTFATPLRQRPLGTGADVVVHSVTEYLSGHSDVVLGVALASYSGLHEALHEEYTDAGGIAGPIEAWLPLRLVRMLPLRIGRIWTSVAELARRFEEHPLVIEIHHPSLPPHPQCKCAKRLVSYFGGVLTVRPVGGLRVAEESRCFTRIWLPMTSLGEAESSFERRRRFPTEAAAVPEDLLCVSVGIENVEDPWRGLDATLKEVHQ